jgi:hypothetical protein
MDFNIASECRKYRDQIVFFKAKGKYVFSDYKVAIITAY